MLCFIIKFSTFSTVTEIDINSAAVIGQGPAFRHNTRSIKQEATQREVSLHDEKRAIQQDP